VVVGIAFFRSDLGGRFPTGATASRRVAVGEIVVRGAVICGISDFGVACVPTGLRLASLVGVGLRIVCLALLALVVEVVVQHVLGVRRVLEGTTLESVGEREVGGLPNVGFQHLRPAVERREGPGGAGQRDVGAVALDARVPAEFRDSLLELGGEGHGREVLAGAHEAVAQGLGLLGELLAEVGPVFERPVENRHSVRCLLAPGDGSLKREPVPELGSEVALLGVHRPD